MDDTPSFTQYIDGRFRPGTGSRTSAVLNPATGQSRGDLVHASRADVDEAVAAAARAYGPWKRTPPIERGRLLLGVAQRLRAQREAIGKRIALELGKPLAEAAREVDTAAEMFEWSAEEGRRAYGRLIPARAAGITQAAVLEPVGPVAAFSGWNAPAITPSRKIAGALAAGCSIVIKPSEETPSVALAIAQAAHDAGIPAGVLNMVFGDPAGVAEQLLAAPQIAMLTFTGATSVGKQLGELAARTMKRATLELGGHAPVLVFDDVDVEAVAKSAVATKFRNSGQVCTSPTRFYVQEKVYERFTAAFVQAAKALKVGDPMDAATQMGPLKNERRLAAIAGLTDDARSNGAKLLCGGERIGSQGWFWQPTVLADFSNDCKAAWQEPFGAMALLRPFANFDDAIAEANRLPFGLAAYAFTRDGRRMADLGEAIESGVVCINEWQASLPETPFGGVKDSGLGSEGGIEGLREFQRVKCIRTGRVG